MLGRIVYSRFTAILLMQLLSIGCINRAHALTWKTPPDALYPANPASFDLAADPSGNAFSVWSDTNFYVSRFSSVTGSYDPPILLFSGTGTDPGLMQVATDATSTALIIAESPDLFPGPLNILTFYFNGTGWVMPSPFPLDIIPGGALAEVQVAMDGNGNGLGIWRNGAGTPPGDILSSFFDRGSLTWGPIQMLNTTGGGLFPAIAYSSNGTAVATWIDGTNNLIASNFSGALPWGAPVTIAPTAIDNLVGIDSMGNAVAIWRDSVTSEVFSSYYTGTWGAPVSVSLTPGVLFDFAMSPSGVGVAVWNDIGGSGLGQYSVFNGGTWGPPAQFATNADNGLAVAVDSVGNAVIIWDNSVLEETFSASLPLGGPLGPTDPVDPTLGPAGNIRAGIAALSDNGRAFLTGTTSGGEGTTLAATYSLLPAPSGISGRVCKNKFPNAAERVKIITWSRSLDPLTVSYYLRRNGKLIAIIPASGPFKYNDHKRCKNTDVYVVTSVNAAGVESNPLTVSIK